MVRLLALAKKLCILKIAIKYADNKFTIPVIILSKYPLNYNEAEIDKISSPKKRITRKKFTNNKIPNIEAYKLHILS